MTDSKSSSTSSSNCKRRTGRGVGVVFITALLVGLILFISCVCFPSSALANALVNVTSMVEAENSVVVVDASSSSFLDEATLSSDSSSITIEDFSVEPINKWTTMNDPVMGGKSHSSLHIDDGIASFEGTCAIVPFLHAPGFITMVTGNPYSLNPFKAKAVFPDVSSCTGVLINVRSSTDYDGYYISFGTDKVPGGHYAMGYKSPLKDKYKVPFGSEFKDVIIPFNEFSSNWDDATGKTKVSCKDDESYCPTISTLQNMKTMTFWGEGVEGDVALDIRYIGAVGCSSTTTNNGYDSDAPFNIAATSAAAAADTTTIIDSSQEQQFGGFTVIDGDDGRMFLMKLVNFAFVGLFSIVVITILASFRTSYRRIIEKESYEELKGNSCIDYDTDTDDDDTDNVNGNDDEVKEVEFDTTKTATVV